MGFFSKLDNTVPTEPIILNTLVVEKDFRRYLVDNNFADDENSMIRILYRSGVWSGIFSKSGAFGGLFGTLAEEKKSWYLSVCQDKIFLFQTGFFKINEIKKDTIKVVNISDITKFTINNKTTYLSEKQLKKDTLVLSLESGTNSFLATIYHDYQFCINNIIYKILYKSKTE